MKNCTIVLVLLTASVVSVCSTVTARAAITDLQNTVSANANLIRHYTFEGASDAERRQDKKGSLDMSEVGGGTLTYAASGFDATTDAIDVAGKALNTTGTDMTFPTTLTVEALMRPDGTTAQGYVVMAGDLEGSFRRGYFLYQGSPPTSDNNDITTTIGDNEAADAVTLVETLTAGHWYYVANTYSKSGTQTTINTHIADLTAGETTLTKVTKTVTGIYPADAELSIGALDWSGGAPLELFDGAIDEVALYGSVLDTATLQGHLDQILIPEPSTFSMAALGLLSLGLVGWRRRRR